MTPEDLRKKAREAAKERLTAVQFPTYTDTGREVARAVTNGFEMGALWHAAQQPSQSNIAAVLNLDGWTCTAHQPEPAGECEDCTMLQMRTAKRVLRLLNGEASNDDGE